MQRAVPMRYSTYVGMVGCCFCGSVILGAFYLFLIYIYSKFIYSTYSLLCCFMIYEIEMSLTFLGD